MLQPNQKVNAQNLDNLLNVVDTLLKLKDSEGVRF